MADEKVSGMAPRGDDDIVRPEEAQPVIGDPSKTHHNVVENARAAAAKERKMSLLQGIKLYPKAIAWSVIISTCIVMEGYQISLVNNFCALARCSLCPACSSR